LGNVNLHSFDCIEPKEGTMRESLVILTAACAIVSVGLLVSEQAQAGGSQSAPTKYSGSTNHVVSGYPLRTIRTTVRGNEFGITEFSSSSARPGTGPRR
jgi:hypothetical protein